MAWLRSLRRVTKSPRLESLASTSGSGHAGAHDGDGGGASAGFRGPAYRCPGGQRCGRELALVEGAVHLHPLAVGVALVRDAAVVVVFGAEPGLDARGVQSVLAVLQSAVVVGKDEKSLSPLELRMGSRKRYISADLFRESVPDAFSGRSHSGAALLEELVRALDVGIEHGLVRARSVRHLVLREALHCPMHEILGRHLNHRRVGGHAQGRPARVVNLGALTLMLMSKVWRTGMSPVCHPPRAGTSHLDRVRGAPPSGCEYTSCGVSSVIWGGVRGIGCPTLAVGLLGDPRRS